MNKIIRFVSIFFLFLLILSCKKSGKKIDRFKDGTIAIVYEYPNIRDTTTYTYTENYPNGCIHKKFSVEKNLITGSPSVYYPSGKVYETDCIYHARSVNSPLWDGLIKRYYENGKIQKMLEVKGGIIQGLAKIFDSNGFLLKEYNLIKDSIKNGPYTEFYHDGVTMTKANFDNDTLNGMMYFFDEKGDTSKYYYRDKGDVAMPYKKWLDNGTTLTGDYIDESQKAVIWKWYTKDGKLIKKDIRYLRNGGFAAPE